MIQLKNIISLLNFHFQRIGIHDITFMIHRVHAHKMCFYKEAYMRLATFVTFGVHDRFKYIYIYIYMACYSVFVILQFDSIGFCSISLTKMAKISLINSPLG